MKMMGGWLWSWDRHSSFPFWGQDEHLQWWWWPYLVTSLISRVCRSRFLRGSKLSQMRFWLALTATPSQRQREDSTSRTCSRTHPSRPQDQWGAHGGQDLTATAQEGKGQVTGWAPVQSQGSHTCPPDLGEWCPGACCPLGKWGWLPFWFLSALVLWPIPPNKAHHPWSLLCSSG